MKKLFLLSVLAIGTLTMRAELTLQCKIDDVGDVSNSIGYGYGHQEPLPIQYLYNKTTSMPSNSTTLSLFDVSNGSLYKTINVGKYADVLYASKNFWTTNNKVSFIAISYENDRYAPVLMDEDGNILQSFPVSCITYPIIIYTNSGFKLTFIEDDSAGNDYTYVYSIPGNGQPTDIDVPTAPARTSSVCKVVENGQMYIILDGVKYAMTGSQTE